MKKLMLIAAIATFSFAANAQSSEKKSTKAKAKTEQMAMKDHVCTASCKDGKHMYAHGEKGHVCGEECKKMKMNKEADKKEMK